MLTEKKKGKDICIPKFKIKNRSFTRPVLFVRILFSTEQQREECHCKTGKAHQRMQVICFVTVTLYEVFQKSRGAHGKQKIKPEQNADSRPCFGFDPAPSVIVSVPIK